MVSPGSVVATDEQLVEAAREGSDVAFEALFRRHRDRITAQVRGMVHDSGRAEDIVQDTFISALRSVRASDQEIAFRPWIQQIARNASIDHLRRVKRTEEISIDSDEFWPDFEGRLSTGNGSTYAAVAQRQDLDDLRQAFGGLPQSQHEILVLREFEGLSYEEIGRRMRLTPAAVESMLSRARRSLKGQFEEIATGERCRRMNPVMVSVSSGLAGKRDRRTLERHVRHCRNCRQQALAMGLESAVSRSRAERMRDALSRAAALLPFPWMLGRRGGDGANASASSAHVTAQGHLANLASVGGAEQTASIVHKAVALVAAAAVAAGGGVAAHRAGVDLPTLGSIANGDVLSQERDAANGDVARDGQSPVDAARGGSGALLPGSRTGGSHAPGAARGAGALAQPGSPALGSVPAAATPINDNGNGILAPGVSEDRDGAPALVDPDTGVPAVPLLGGAGSGEKKSKDKGKDKDSGGSQQDTVVDTGAPAVSVPERDLPPGIQKKLDNGGRLPPGIEKKLDGDATSDALNKLPKVKDDKKLPSVTVPTTVLP